MANQSKEKEDVIRLLEKCFGAWNKQEQLFGNSSYATICNKLNWEESFFTQLTNPLQVQIVKEEAFKNAIKQLAPLANSKELIRLLESYFGEWQEGNNMFGQFNYEAIEEKLQWSDSHFSKLRNPLNFQSKAVYPKYQKGAYNKAMKQVLVLIRDRLSNEKSTLEKQIEDKNNSLEELGHLRKNLLTVNEQLEEKGIQNTQLKIAIENSEKKFQQIASRRDFFKRLFFGVITVGVGVGGIGTIKAKHYLDKYSAEQEKYKNYKLWSTVKDIPQKEKNERLYKIYKTVMQPITYLVNDNARMRALLNSLANKTRDEQQKNCYYFLELDTIEPRQKTPPTTTRYSYDFSNGLGVITPTANTIVEEQDQRTKKDINVLKDRFVYINTEITGRHNKIKPPNNHEEGLKFLLDLENTTQNVIAPVLFFCLFFSKEQRDSKNFTKGLMYRYPFYTNPAYPNPAESYLKYDHFERPFFQDYRHKTGLQLDKNVWLSSIYPDFGEKTIMPIRTLVFEEDTEEGLFLVCIDFKFIDTASD